MSNDSSLYRTADEIAMIRGIKWFFTFSGVSGGILGLLGSFLTIAILLRDHRLRISTRLFQGLLTICDALVLLTSNLRLCILGAFYFDIRQISAGVCRWHTFLTYFSGDVSTWALCALTLERFVLVTWPTMGHGSSPRRTRIFGLVVCTCLCLAGFSKDVVPMWRVWDTQNGTFDWPCTYQMHLNIDRSLYLQFDLALYTIVPNVVVIVSCVGILKVLGGRKRQVAPNNNNNDNSNRTDDVERQARIATKMMLGLGLVYFLTGLPGAIYLILSAIPDSVVVQYEEKSQFLLIMEGFIFIQLSANMSRFYVCVLSSNHFRSELVRLFRRAAEVQH